MTIDPHDELLGRNGDFVRLWTGGAVSSLGSSMAALAYPLLALGITGSAGVAGTLALVTLAAGTVMRLPAGVLIDQMSLRAVLIWSDLVRAAATATAVIFLITGRLTFGLLLVLAMATAGCAVFNDTAHSVALRDAVPPAQLPKAFALNDGRGHAVGLIGQPAGGHLYGIAPALPLVADAVSFVASAILSGSVKRALGPPNQDTSPARRGVAGGGRDLLAGLRFVWTEPFLRASLLSASAIQLVLAAATFALLAAFTGRGASPASIGTMFAVAAVGGILGAVLAPALQSRFAPHTLIVILGWTTTSTVAALAWVSHPLVAGVLLGVVYLTAAPANASLSAAQVQCTPRPLQGQVMAAGLLIAGLLAPFGPPGAGVLLDATGQPTTFWCLAALTAVVTIAIHLSRPMRMINRSDA